MSRNAFVLKLLEVYLGSAYVDYQNGYGVPFNEDPHVFPVSQLEKLIEKVNPSVEAQEYLQRTVFSALGMPELLGENNDQIRGNSVKRLYSTRRNKQERRSLWRSWQGANFGSYGASKRWCKNELFTLSVENYRDFSDFLNQKISIAVGAMAMGRNVIFYVAKGARPELAKIVWNTKNSELGLPTRCFFFLLILLTKVGMKID